MKNALYFAAGIGVFALAMALYGQANTRRNEAYMAAVQKARAECEANEGSEYVFLAATGWTCVPPEISPNG